MRSHSLTYDGLFAKPTSHALILVSIFMLDSIACSRVYGGGPAFTRQFGAAEDASTALSTPAGMTRLDKEEWVVDALAAQSLSKFKVDRESTNVGGGDPRDSDPIIVPSLHYVRPLGDRWRTGLSLSVPTGFGSQFGPNWAGRYYSDQFTLYWVTLAGSVAYRVTPWLSVGGGVTLNYSSSESTTQVRNLETDRDAKLVSDSDGAGLGFTLSALVEFDPSTRIGMTFVSENETDNDLEYELKRSDLPTDIVDAINTLGRNTDVKIRSPAVFQLGFLRQWNSGCSISVDAMWVDFSRFGLSELKVLGEELEITDVGFNDFWVWTLGASMPLSQRLDARFGVMYVERPVEDEDRTLSFSLDRMYGAGIGFQYQRHEGDTIIANLTVINTGSAPVDTGDDPIAGRVVGSIEDHYLFALELSYRFH